MTRACSAYTHGEFLCQHGHQQNAGCRDCEGSITPNCLKDVHPQHLFPIIYDETGYPRKLREDKDNG